MTTAAYAEALKLNTDALVELYSLDTSALLTVNGVANQGPVYYWTPGTLSQKVGGTILATGGNNVILDQVISIAPNGGYSLTITEPSNGGFFTCPVTAFGELTSPGPALTFVTVSGLQNTPPPGSTYVLSGPGVVFFQGIAYEPFPVALTGMEWNGQGQLPRPKLQIDNTVIVGTGSIPLAAALVITFQDILGATITRQRTFAKFLDGQPDADPTAVFEPDRFTIDRKSQHNRQVIEFECASSIDQMGLQLPARQILRDTCNFTYRSWNAASEQFVYGTCPYTGSAYFAYDGTPQTNPAMDVCRKNLALGCLMRYPQPQAIPFAGFPGVGLTSIS